MKNNPQYKPKNNPYEMSQMAIKQCKIPYLSFQSQIRTPPSYRIPHIKVSYPIKSISCTCIHVNV